MYLPLFQRTRDGRVRVRLSDEGREFVREQFGRLRVAEEDTEHAWHQPLNQPIDPGSDDDDPLRILERQKTMATNAELALLTVDEPVLSEGEAWAWFMSLQLVLRACAEVEGISTEDDLAERSDEELMTVHVLQQLLSDLTESLS
jgi:hypothetical protein